MSERAGDYDSVHAPKSREDALLRGRISAESRYGKVVHMCPELGKDVTPCCEQRLATLPRWHRVTAREELVTCGRSIDQALAGLDLAADFTRSGRTWVELDDEGRVVERGGTDA